MTSDSLKPPEKRYGYRGALMGLMNLLREEGVKGLCRGLGTNAVRAFNPVVFHLNLSPFQDTCGSHECAHVIKLPALS